MSKPQPFYPETIKVFSQYDLIQELNKFLKWCDENGYVLHVYRNRKGGDSATPLIKTRDDLLDAYLGIDSVKLEKERRTMLAELNSDAEEK